MKVLLVINLLLFPLLASAIDATQSGAKNLNFDLSDIAPYNFLENGKLVGINAEYIHHLEKNSGLKFNLQFFPHARMIKRLETESTDAMLIFRTICNKFPVSYEPLISLNTIVPSIYVKKFTSTNMSDIRIARVRGTCTQLAKDYIKKNNIEEVGNMRLAFRMLNAGRIDGVCGNPPLIRYYNVNPHIELSIYKTQKKLPDFQAVVCVKKSLSPAIKAQLLDGATKSLSIAQKLENLEDFKDFD